MSDAPNTDPGADPRAFDHLVFDLDDTLLDTYGQLIPRASREACTAMITAGMSSTLEECLSAWDAHGRQQAKEQARREVFSSLVAQFGVRGGVDPKGVVARGHHAFYNRRIESDISLFPGAGELLARLEARYHLHLVTAGPRATQRQKLEILGLTEIFESIWHIDPALGERKGEAFAKIMNATSSPPQRHLSIGNRIDTDIAEARALGWRACWVRYGEHAAMLPSSPIEEPEFTVDRVTEVEARCRL